MFRLPSLLLFCSLFLWLPAHAQEAALYEGETTVDSQSAEQRTAALPRALAQVLVKVSGDPAVVAAANADGALGGAPSLMQRYRYRQDTVMNNGVPALKTVLIAQFDQAAVDALIGSVGHTIWPSPRPKPLLWLAIDDGRGARLVGDAQSSAVGSLLRRGGERGLGFAFPKADMQDQTVAGAQAVWRGDVTAVRSAAARYGATSVLIGKMQRGAGGWSTEWILLDGSSELRRWSSVDADATAVLAAGADGAASTFARRYAQDILTGDAGDYVVVIAALQGADDYGRVLQYLQTLPIVQTVGVREVSDDGLVLDLALRTGMEGLTRLIERGGVLRADGMRADAPVFALQR